MKKVLSTVAALGLVAGLASTAAAVEFQMSGKYLVEGVYMNSAGENTTLGFPGGNGVQPALDKGKDAVSDGFFMHTFEMKPTMKVNDKISMFGNIRLADDTIWGNQAGGDINTGRGTGLANGDVEIWHLYMEYESPIGKFRIGRTPAGGFGYTFMDFDSRGDRIMWYPNIVDKPWKLEFYVEKGTDNQTHNAANPAYGAFANGAQSDADKTKYVARAYYNTDMFDAAVDYGYTNNMTLATQADQKHEVIGYGKLKYDNLYVLGELTHFFGSVDQDVQTALLKDRDYNSWAGIIKAGGKWDALSPSIAYAYAEGQKRGDTAANGGDLTAALIGSSAATTGTGDQFTPLYILTGRYTGILNNDVFNGYTAGAAAAGMHAVVAQVDYAVSPQLNLHGGIGWAKADEAQIVGQGDTYGWEYNVGAAYKLLDNLTYEAHFGYLDTGDFFEFADPAHIDTKNIYLMTHSLTMTF